MHRLSPNEKRRLSVAFASVAIFLLALTVAPCSAQLRDGSARELSGISESEAFEVKDDLEVDHRSEMVRRVLYRARKTSPQSRNQFCQQSADVAWKAIYDDTFKYRFWMFRREAKIQRVVATKFRNSPESAEIQQFYVAYGYVQDGDEKIGCRIITRKFPEKLKTGAAFDEPVSFEGFLYCRAKDDTADSKPELVFIADHVAWHPDDPENRANSSDVALASLGYDVAQLDNLEPVNFKGLTKLDTEPFFGMIAAIKNATGDLALSRQPIRRVSLPTLLRNSKENFGSAIQLTAVCRSCTLTQVPYPDVQNRMGVKQYYQLILFPRLSETVVISEGENQVKFDQYPVTVCCTELPEGMTPKDMEKRRVSVDGFFYRLWKFDTELTDNSKISGAISPIIIARSPVPLESNTADLNRYVLIFVLSIIGGIGALLIYLRVTDKRDKTHAQQMMESLPDKIDVEALNDIDG